MEHSRAEAHARGAKARIIFLKPLSLSAKLINAAAASGNLKRPSIMPGDPVVIGPDEPAARTPEGGYVNGENFTIEDL